MRRQQTGDRDGKTSDRRGRKRRKRKGGGRRRRRLRKKEVSEDAGDSF